MELQAEKTLFITLLGLNSFKAPFQNVHYFFFLLSEILLYNKLGTYWILVGGQRR